MAVIRHAVIELDVLALNKEKLITNAANVSGLTSRQYEFMSSDQKIEAFVTWMNEQTQQYILSGGRSGIRSFGSLLPEATEARNSWIKTYIDSGYQQGIKRGRQELKKLGIEVDDGSYPGSTSDPIQVSFNNPMNADRVGLIYTRAYSSLKGITAEMDSIVSDVLALGMADGRGPREIARLLNKVITGMGTGDDLAILDSLGRKIPALRRAEVLARTEIIRAHHQANIAEYRAAGIMGIKIQAEFLTAGDNRVCRECSDKAMDVNGKMIIYSIDEVENMIPVHPQCRCVALPYIPEN
jgi:SPP1 gp7 family putative phage head morphogenesis protein